VVDWRKRQVMLSKINEDSFFDKVNFLDITRREETMSKYNVLAINPERSYYREPSVKVQVVHRYLAMQQLNTLCTVSDDDTIILTRPDILPKNRSMIPIMNKTIDEFCYDSKKEILLFYHGGIPHDCIIVGKKKSLNQLFSPKVYNTNKYAQAHENLDNMVKMFNTTRVLVPDSYYYANSPNMKQY
jgi:hypothetical protein